MPLKCFGIFLAYGPTVDLRKEGLGRLLSAFLKAAATRDDVRFVIACPQWSKPGLLALCESEGIPATAFDIVSPDGVPFLLRLYLAYLARKRSPRKESLLARLLARTRHARYRHLRSIERHMVAARNPLAWFAIALYVAILSIIILPWVAALWFLQGVVRVLIRLSKKLHLSDWLNSALAGLMAIIQEPGEEILEIRLYRLMEEAETERMRERIDGLPHVKAWFSPTSFWPAFNKIAAPALLVVPDVAPAEFPVGFAREADLFKTFEIVERSIRGGRYFVTYSARTKWHTLVDRYAVNPEKVAVVPHACWDLSPWIKVSGFSNEEHATRAYCESLLQQALIRTGIGGYVRGLDSGSMPFLFYASQFRPNKNLVLLLRAYEHLLRDRFIQHKLILTGDPKRYPPIMDFVREKGLSLDVLFLHGLTTPELAACYYLADLAVNASLSEGGCPFTLTEALSVDTPVVMARIPVTEEVIVDPALQEMMLFDPYDYRDAASRIEWALHHRDLLLPAQKEFYARLRQRTWRTVVDEYVTILDGLA